MSFHHIFKHNIASSVISAAVVRVDSADTALVHSRLEACTALLNALSTAYKAEFLYRRVRRQNGVLTSVIS